MFKECVGGVTIMCVSKIDVYFQFILIAAFIVDVGRVIFSRGVYKIRVFPFTMIWLIYLIKYCMVKILVFVSFPNGTIRLSLFITDCTDSLQTVFRQTVLLLQVQKYTNVVVVNSNNI